jgi:hypothetical protein
MLNYLSAEMESAVGLPGIMPRFPARPPRAIIQSGNVTMHHINIDRSSIGVVNTGYIGQVDSAIGTMRSSGDASGAEGFKQFTEALVSLQSVDSAHKNKLLEILSVLASEATLPPEKRRKSAMRSLLVELATLTSGVADLATLYAHFGPAILALFQ